MDKLIVITITLLIISVFSMSVSTLHDINDGRIEIVIKQLTK